MSQDADSRLGAHAMKLREHIGLPLRPGDPPPAIQPHTEALFFVELAPSSDSGSGCKLPTCARGPVRPGDYRIALNPSMDDNNPMRGREGSAGTSTNRPNPDHPSRLKRSPSISTMSRAFRGSPTLDKPIFWVESTQSLA